MLSQLHNPPLDCAMCLSEQRRQMDRIQQLQQSSTIIEIVKTIRKDHYEYVGSSSIEGYLISLLFSVAEFVR